MVFAFVLIAFGLSALLAEIILRGEKLQSKMGGLLSLFGIAGLATIAAAASLYNANYLATLIFWGGSFLSWFGIRSHIESSILLRLLYLLRTRPSREDELLKRYEDMYGRESRIEELLRAGLIRTDTEEPVLTPKGRTILRIADHLK